MPITNSASAIMPGTVAHFAAATAPVGWIKANGAAVSRTLYAGLFLAIGTTYGAGDGATTFNVPDLRGEFLRSLDDGRGVDAGRGIGTVQAGQNLSHKHQEGVANSTGGSYFGMEAVSGNSGTPTNRDSIVAGMIDYSVYLTGTSGGAEARPRNVALLACIKY